MKTRYARVSGTALLPSGPAGASRVGPLAGELAEHFGVDVYVSERNSVPRADIPDAVRETTAVAELARQLGRPRGLRKLADMLLEFQITRPGPARDLLIGLVRVSKMNALT